VLIKQDHYLRLASSGTSSVTNSVTDSNTYRERGYTNIIDDTLGLYNNGTNTNGGEDEWIEYNASGNGNGAINNNYNSNNSDKKARRRLDISELKGGLLRETVVSKMKKAVYNTTTTTTATAATATTNKYNNYNNNKSLPSSSSSPSSSLPSPLSSSYSRRMTLKEKRDAIEANKRDAERVKRGVERFFVKGGEVEREGGGGGGGVGGARGEVVVSADVQQREDIQEKAVAKEEVIGAVEREEERDVGVDDYFEMAFYMS
jgi:hypothetical protein